MTSILIKNGLLINENEKFIADIFIEGDLITEISKNGINRNASQVIEAEGKWVMPGVIDDQVHFREPGLTHKAEIYTEAKAAVAGGTPSFMEMPNTNPQATTQLELEKKYSKGEFEMIQYAAGLTIGGVENEKKVNEPLPMFFASELVQSFEETEGFEGKERKTCYQEWLGEEHSNA